MMTVGIPKEIDARTAALLELRKWLDFEVRVMPQVGSGNPVCRGMIEAKRHFQFTGPPLMVATALDLKLAQMLGTI